ncbi:MAG: C15orf41 family protein [Methanosarcinaceae archaeon]
MDRNTYFKIRDSLNSTVDIEHVSFLFTQPVGVISAILDQKIVSMVKSIHGRIKSESKKHAVAWKRGDTILNIANRNGIPATLMASMILKEMGHSKKHINRLFKDPNNIQKQCLRNEIIQALNSDHFFSPKAHRIQTEKSEMGESIIEKWLESQNIGYRNETELRSSGMTRTPDCVLDTALTIDDMEITWIESKALFGDETEHKNYSIKQFKHYEQEYGAGMVVYWYGHLDSITLDGHLIKDHKFFGEVSDNVQALLNHGNNW